MQLDATNYTGSHFFPDAPLGTEVQGWRNENLEKQTFADESFDLVVTLDVMEHLFDPIAATGEIYRTLKPGGAYICTFPIKKEQVEAFKFRALLRPDDGVELLAPEERHGNPIDSEGSLVTVDYGYDIHQALSEWAPFDVSIIRKSDRTAGVLGEFTEVIVCTKPAANSPLTEATATSAVADSPQEA